MDKPHSLNVAANVKYHIQNPGKRGGGEIKTVAMMTRTHPEPSARESILLF